jgi:hypothetical protein
MPKRKRPPDKPGAQSRRFLEAAKAAEADVTGRKFDKVFKKLVRPKSH